VTKRLTRREAIAIIGAAGSAAGDAERQPVERVHGELSDQRLRV